MKQTEDQIAKMLSTYESTIRRQAAEKKELRLQLSKIREGIAEARRGEDEQTERAIQAECKLTEANAEIEQLRCSYSEDIGQP